MKPTADTDRSEILHRLEQEHDRLLAELAQLDERIEAALRGVRGDGVDGAGSD